MRLQRLKLINFRQHAGTEITFGSGITAVIGPNGAGKSTLLEAVAWAIYGSTAARGSREFIRFNRAPARAPVRVELEFGLGAHTYRVVRGLYQAELYLDGGDRPVANSQQEVSAKLERVLGMTRDEFFNTYFTGQKELAVMARLGPADRARFLSQVLGYEKLRQAQDLLRQQRSQLRAEHIGLEHGLADEGTLREERAAAATKLDAARRRVRQAERAKAGAERKVAAEGPAWSRMVTLRESVLSLDGERRLAEQRVDEARREFGRLDKELAAALDARKKLDGLAARLAQAERLKLELAELDREAQSAGRRRDLTGQQREVGDQLARAAARLAELEDVESRLQAVQAELEAAHAELARARELDERVRTNWVRDKQDAQTKLDALRDQYRDLEEHRGGLERAGPEGTCPTCLRPLGEEYEAVIGTLARQLEEIELNGKYFRQRVDQLAVEPEEVRDAAVATRAAAQRLEEGVQRAERLRERGREREGLRVESERLRDRLASLTAEIASLPDRYDAARHEASRQALRELDPAVALAVQLRVQAERAEALVADAEAADKLLTQRETHLQQLVAAIGAAGFTEEGFQAARERYEAAERAIHEAELDLTTVRGDRRAAEQLVELADKRLAERAERAGRLVRLKEDIRLHDELDRGLGDLRTDLNAQMRPELSETASTFIAELTDGRYQELELDEEYRIIVMEDGAAKPVISGGEEDIANLALRLAISQMVADRAGQPLSLLVLDEVFGSLDEDRREHVVTLLRHLADRFPQVLLLTHVEAMRAGVDRLLRVAYDADTGVSVVTEDQGAPREDVAA